MNPFLLVIVAWAVSLKRSVVIGGYVVPAMKPLYEIIYLLNMILTNAINL